MDINELKELIKPAFASVGKLPKEEAKNYGNYKLMPVEILVKAGWNYKQENPYTSDKLNANLKRNGQVENIQVRLLDTGYYEVVNGNHRLDEIIKLGRKMVVVYDHGKVSLAEAKRIAIETNETKFKAEETLLAEAIRELEAEFGLEDLEQTLPFSDEEMEKMMSEMDSEFEEPTQGNYTRKIESPTYEPKNEKPHTIDLYDKSKYEQLLEGIEGSSADPEVKMFLKIAAARHIVFDYSKIADFYAHSDAQVQRLMEDSALVIIDFNRAIELGFVQLSENIAKQYTEDYGKA